MARPKANQLTERELELMQIFWDHGQLTVAEVQEELAAKGRDLAYTTVATLVKILHEKQFVDQIGHVRPFTFQPKRTFEEVSGNILGDIVKKVFGGSREKLLIRLMEQKRLSKKERKLLEEILEDNE